MDFLHRCRFLFQICFSWGWSFGKGDGDFGNLCFFFGGLLVFFWLAGVKGTAFLEQRPGMQTFFCGWKERRMKMVMILNLFEDFELQKVAKSSSFSAFLNLKQILE